MKSNSIQRTCVVAGEEEIQPGQRPADRKRVVVRRRLIRLAEKA
jgi:hypothetical protein